MPTAKECKGRSLSGLSCLPHVCSLSRPCPQPPASSDKWKILVAPLQHERCYFGCEAKSSGKKVDPEIPPGVPWALPGLWLQLSSRIPLHSQCFHTKQRAQIQGKKQWPHPGVAIDRGTTPPTPPSHQFLPPTHSSGQPTSQLPQAGEVLF